MSAALDSLQQKANQIDAAIATLREFIQANLQKIAAIDPKDPTALAQIEELRSEATAAAATYNRTVQPIFAEMKVIANNTPNNERVEAVKIYEDAVARNEALLKEAGTVKSARDAKQAEAQAAIDAINKEATDAAAKPPAAEQESNKYAATGAPQDDKGNPPIAGQPAAAISNPTTQAGKTNAHDGQSGYSYTEKPRPGKRLSNPLSNFSSYTYQISLYMITPDAYNAFVASGRTDINAINNFGQSTRLTATQQQRDAATSANAPTRTGGAANGDTSTTETVATANTGGAYLIAQSGGINNATSKRAPGFNLDFYIDNLKIVNKIGSPETQSTTNIAEFGFDIIEPYGFSFLSKLKVASNTLQAASSTKNYAQLINATRNLFVLGFQFLGYDKDGNVIDPSKIPSTDANPQGNAFGLYQRYYDIQINDLKFKIDGKPVVYAIKATTISHETAFKTKRGVVWTGASITGKTVRDALEGSQVITGKPNESNEAKALAGDKATSIGLLTKLNADQQSLLNAGTIGIATVYAVKFRGRGSEKIANASLISTADLDKRFWGESSVSSTSQVNQSAENKSTTPNDTVRQIALGKGITILQAINDIIKQSSYLENALTAVFKSDEEPNTETVNSDAKPNYFPKEISWFSCNAEVENLGWDIKQNDFVYKITYVIQPYLTPSVLSAYAGLTTKYYGPDKRYDYWFTGNNSEVISFSQEINNGFFTVSMGSFENIKGGAGGPLDIPVIPGQPQNQPKQGIKGLNYGLAAQNSYMSSLFDPYSWAAVKLNILGDPDFLMQPSPDTLQTNYDQFYQTDGYTINSTSRQVFIELNFKEPIDYDNSSGILNINESIYFYAYPKAIEQDLKQRGGGIILEVISVTSTFNKGKFEQELTCRSAIFTEATSKNAEADAGRDGSDNRFARQGNQGTATSTANQTAATQARTGVNLSNAGAGGGRGFVNGAPPNNTGTGSSGKVPNVPNVSMKSAPNATTLTPVRGGLSAKQNQTGTRPTKTGPVQDDERGKN